MVHVIPDNPAWAKLDDNSEIERVMRMRRVLVLDPTPSWDKSGPQILICTAEGNELHDEDEGVSMRDVDYVCTGREQFEYHTNNIATS